MKDKTILSRAIDSLFYRDLDAALAEVESILDSKYVGSEARRRRDEILARIRKRVRSYTEKIEANPKDAQNYLLRAQQYYCLRETENMIADMEMYVNILSPLDETNPHDLWFRDFLMGLWQSTPKNLGPTVNSSEEEWGSSLSPDGLSLYFESSRPGGEGKNDIWVSMRATKEDDWGARVNLGAPINTSAIEQSPCISADGLELYFNDHPLGRRAGSVTNGGDLWVARRATISDPWGEPENLGLTSNINTSKGGLTPSLSSDGLSLFLASPWPKNPWLNDWDLYVATRPTRDDVWSEPVNLGPTVNGVNSTSLNFCPAISADGLLLVFSSNRSGGYGGQDLWITRRSTIDGPWSEPVNLGPTINSGKWEVEPEISPDGRSLLFCSSRGGGHGDFDIWEVEVHPVVDLNGDGLVNSGDMTVMVNHWGDDYSPCDIGPLPWGDGIVDVEDLIVLSEHLFEDVNDPTLVAHWPLDETEGIRTREIVSDKDDYALGGAIWEPTGGKVGGALQLDGVDDSVVTSVKLDPADGPFSVIAWVKGGGPGQVVISETAKANWLMVDDEGRLMSELSAPGRSAESLRSEIVINDGQWHRIGLVWDGSHIMLYADGSIVAEDMQDFLEGSGNGQYIGTGKAMEPGTFWSGLIDDVRIYNRAVKP